MVHALSEVWRTLMPGGLVLDIRPYLPFGPLELVDGPIVEQLGRLDEAEFDPGDPAAGARCAPPGGAGFVPPGRLRGFAGGAARLPEGLVRRPPPAPPAGQPGTS